MRGTRIKATQNRTLFPCARCCFSVVGLGREDEFGPVKTKAGSEVEVPAHMSPQNPQPPPSNDLATLLREGIQKPGFGLILFVLGLTALFTELPLAVRIAVALGATVSFAWLVVPASVRQGLLASLPFGELIESLLSLVMVLVGFSVPWIVAEIGSVKLTGRSAFYWIELVVSRMPDVSPALAPFIVAYLAMMAWFASAVLLWSAMWLPIAVWGVFNNFRKQKS